MSNLFKLVSRISSNGLINVSKYVSERTGLRITIADVDGPTVSGFCCIATETKSDDGLPHTLEHLVFMGSENYPCKGILDLLANRCLASGTNAFTEQHYTCYTLKTAGSDGFMKMLPIYLDHIFHPLLTEAQYKTEVHHINGEGEDAGVVYCEMQEDESKMKTISIRTAKELVYPGDTGYRFDTGGRLVNLRTSTNNQKVKSFHKHFYNPKNLNVIISGTVPHEKIFETVVNVENNILLKEGFCDGPFKRPWTDPVPEMKETVEVVKQCPADDETKGIVVVAWRGPKSKNFVEITAITCLLSYLSESAVSPLRKEFVEVREPVCSKVSANILEYAESMVYFNFKGTLKEKLNEVKGRLFDVIMNLGAYESHWDMERLRDILQQNIEKTQCCFETDPHEALSSLIISDFLYGDTEEDFKMRLNEVTIYSELLSKDTSFWMNLLKRYFIDKPYALVICEPCVKLIDKMSAIEKERIEKQKVLLGDVKLGELGEELEMAIEENEENAPDADLLETCLVNSMDGVKFFDVQHLTNFNGKSVQLPRYPFTVVLDDCKTKFINLCASMDTSQVPDDLRALLPLWKSVIFESPILRDGALVPYEDVVKEYNRDLVQCAITTGVHGPFHRLVSLSVKVTQAKHEKAINWLREFLYCVQFTEERIRIVAQRLANSAADKKRDGSVVAHSLLLHLICERNSNSVVESILLLEKSMNSLVARLNSEPIKVIEDFERLNDIITDPAGFILHTSCNLSEAKAFGGFPHSLENVVDSKKLQRDDITKQHSRSFFGLNEPRYLRPMTEFNRGAIIAIGGCDSSFMCQSTPLTLKPDDDDLASLYVLSQYLGMCEGVLWRLIRGRGIAYGCSVTVSYDAGLLSFGVWNSTHLIQAYEECKTLIEHLANGGEEFDEDDFEAAKRSLIFEIIDDESTVEGACNQAFLSHFRGVDLSYNKTLLDKIWHISEDSLQAVCKKYLLRLFDFQTSCTAITCNPSKLDELVGGFKALGRNLSVKKLDDASF